jgi:hypothetical protein
MAVSYQIGFGGSTYHKSRIGQLAEIEMVTE